MTYTHGHHETVLCSHSWRTAANSAAYLLPHLRESDRLLDIGAGPGTITADFAAAVAHVTATEIGQRELDLSRTTMAHRGLRNVEFSVQDVHGLTFKDDSFDVVHAHQVLQHVADPVNALREMARVTRPGALVAARDADYAGPRPTSVGSAPDGEHGPIPRTARSPSSTAKSSAESRRHMTKRELPSSR